MELEPDKKESTFVLKTAAFWATASLLTPAWRRFARKTDPSITV
jgi:hypothetical protein